MHGHESKTRWEHLAYKGVIVGMDYHLLIKVADVLYGISPPIVNGKRQLRKSRRKLDFVNPLDEG